MANLSEQNTTMDDLDFGTTVSEDMILNYHLMHPGGNSGPGDPNAAFFVEGTYHLHYILRHPWQTEPTNPPTALIPYPFSFSFVHVTSDDMLHWRWQKTKLQPSLTGHGMFSGTGFITKDDRPAVIYHGQGTDQNHIAIAKDKMLSAWEKPYALSPKNKDGTEATIGQWDPDCFLINDTYYAVNGGSPPTLMKSHDLTNWIYLGDFLKKDLPDVVIGGEDVSCPNFFQLGEKWMLLCISHSFGCRYYIGNWDAENEKFEPEQHGRMNWRRSNQSIHFTEYRDFFAPESVVTPDGRRVMWAWFCTLNDKIRDRTIQSLPRELNLAKDNSLRIRPLRELEILRYGLVTFSNITVSPPEVPDAEKLHRLAKTSFQQITTLEGDAFEIQITIERGQAYRKRLGIQLFSGGESEGLTIMIHPEKKSISIGSNEAPFAVDDLPADEALDLRIFVDKYLVEVFANDRQSVVAVHMDYRSANGLGIDSYWVPTTIHEIQIWKLKSTNQGLFDARKSRIWEPNPS